MLLTKLHIPVPGPNLVHRQDLIDRLNAGLHRKLILVSAPAGFGKTTLICDWLAHSGIHAAWVSLDKRDNNVSEFIGYIVRGLQTIDPEIGKLSEKLLQAQQKPDFESILSELINDILESENIFVLVLDDFHFIKSIELIEMMKFLLNHLPANLHLAILSRSDPPVSLSRLRSQNELVELRSSDLSFSANDAFVFLNKKLKLDLSIEDIELLETKTEGWIAGLQLSALSMQGRNDLSKFIRALAGDNRYIMDYLLEEVLSKQDKEIEEFLIGTSMLEQVSGELADSLLLTNNSQAILEKLEKDNMFIVPLDVERKWFRYHHLFGDLLKQRLHQRDRDFQNTLHNRASEWYGEHAHTALAIEHAIEAGNHEKAMSLLNEVVEDLWKTGQHATIMKFGCMLSEESIACNPNFCLYYAWILNSAGHLEKADQVLRNAEKLAMAKLPENNRLLGQISVAFTYLLSSSRNTDRILHYCEQAQRLLTEDDPLWYSWAWLSYGVACVYTGKIKESSIAFEKAFTYGKVTQNLYLMTTAISRLVYGQLRLGNYTYSFKRCKELLTLLEDAGYAKLVKRDWANSGLFTIYGYIHYMWNKLDEGLALAKLGYELSIKGNDFISQVFSTLVYAWILLFKGDKIKTESLISTMDRTLHEKDIFNTLPFSLTGQIIKIYILLNKLDRADSLIQSLGLSLDAEINYLDEMAYISYARFLITTEDISKAEGLLHKLETIGEPGERVESLIEIKLLSARLAIDLDDIPLAKKRLAEALGLAEKENLMMFFVEEGLFLGNQLKDINPLPAEISPKPSKKFIDKINLAIEKKHKARQEFYMDPMSPRELEVLSFMVEDLSNQEIADKLFVSVNTVKSHVKNIHLKLEVNSRSRAVTRATELGII